jgi:peptidoglycan/xylan/chitin deacetylase (PgdA/CDA1 family)
MTLQSGKAACIAGWEDLGAELDAWAAGGRMATLWWRDDDAVAPTPALEAQFEIAGSTPLALAVIPAETGPALADLLWHRPGVSVLQHGWAHVDHSLPGSRKMEYGPDRPSGEALAELAAGQARLRALFGARFLPVLVPPWNRIAPDLLARLAEAGFAGVSTLGPRRTVAGLTEVNVHADLVDWSAGGFVGEGRALGQIVAHLAARRAGRVDADEPTGIMTHHLVQDAPTGAFLRRLCAATHAHPAARWLAAAAAFDPA